MVPGCLASDLLPLFPHYCCSGTAPPSGVSFASDCLVENSGRDATASINTAPHIRLAQGRGTKDRRRKPMVSLATLQSNWGGKTTTHVTISEKDKTKGGESGVNVTEGQTGQKCGEWELLHGTLQGTYSECKRQSQTKGRPSDLLDSQGKGRGRGHVQRVPWVRPPGRTAGLQHWVSRGERAEHRGGRGPQQRGSVGTSRTIQGTAEGF